MEQEINMNKPLFLRAADRERSKRRAQYRYKTTEHVQNRKHKASLKGQSSLRSLTMRWQIR